MRGSRQCSEGGPTTAEAVLLIQQQIVLIQVGCELLDHESLQNLT